jgi:type IV secretory pathway TrbF-like protein
MLVAKKAVTPISKSTTEKESPYLIGRRQWDERYGSLISRATNWRTAAFLSLGCLLVSLIGLVALALKSRVVPYVVAVDSIGHVVSQGVATEASVADDRLKRAALFDWIKNLRMVSSDMVIERGAIDKVYAMIGNGSPAATKVSAFYTGSSPLVRAQTEVVSVDVHTLYATSPDTYQIEWTENRMDLTGAPIGSQNYKGSFRIAVHPPSDEGLARVNPLGIYVTDVEMSKVL